MDIGETQREGTIVPDTTPVPMVAPAEAPAEAPVPEPERETVEV